MLIANDNVIIGFLTIIFGPIAAWISEWLLYGFGQLIENSDIIAEEFSRKNAQYEKAVAHSQERKQAQRRKEVKAIIANQEIDEDVFVDITCPNCKTELSYTKGQLQSKEGATCPMCDTHISM